MICIFELDTILSWQQIKANIIKRKSHRNDQGLRTCEWVCSFLFKMIRAQMMHKTHACSYLLLLIKVMYLYWEFESGKALQNPTNTKIQGSNLVHLAIMYHAHFESSFERFWFWVFTISCCVAGLYIFLFVF